jgi:membrane fusion protein, multidrug efflux system
MNAETGAHGREKFHRNEASPVLPLSAKSVRKPRLWLRLMVMLVGLAVLFSLIFGFGAFKAIMIRRFLANLSNPISTVATITAQTTQWQSTLSAVGTINAVNGANMAAEVAGIVDTINFESGQDVAQHTLLMTLRPNNDDALVAQLRATETLDRLTYERDQRQFAAKAVSQATLDTDRANLDSATAQVQSQLALMTEKKVYAPFAGRLGIRQVNIGQYLAAGATVVTLEQLDPIYVDFYLPQKALAQISVGQSTDLTIDSSPEQSFPGTIVALDSAIDTSSRNIQVRALVQNPKLLLRPGMFGTVSIGVGKPQELVTLPQTAVTYNPYGDTVFLAVPGKNAEGEPQLIARQVFVTLGETRGDQVSILKGVNAGDAVVSAGSLKLRNGALLAVNNTIQPSDSPNPNPPNE